MCGHGVLFTIGGFALSSLGDETAGMSAKAQLTPAKTTTIEGRKGAVFTTATHSKRQQGRQDSWDIGVENKDEMIRVSRNG